MTMSLDIIGIIKLAAIKGYRSKKTGNGCDNLYSDQPSSAGVSSGAHSQVSLAIELGRINFMFIYWLSPQAG